MRTCLIFLFLLPFTLFAQAVCQLTGEGFEGADNTVIRLIRNGESSPSHEIKLLSGKFSVSITLDEPTLYFLLTDNQARPFELFLEPGKVKMRPKPGSAGEYEVNGSKSHVEFKSFVQRIMPAIQLTSQLSNSINTSSDVRQRDSLTILYQSAQAKVQAIIDSTIDSNPNSSVAPFILSATYGFNEDPVLLERRFNKISPSVRSSSSGKAVATLIADSRVGAIGSIAPDFTQDDPSGKPISLSSFRGKYVLVDFWASWCGPCRSENPTVVENYNRFKDKNFTILGVSLDRPGQKDRWLQAIKDDELAWTQVSDLKFWNNAAAKLYKVNGIPQNFLIDPKGVIIAKNLRGAALGEKLCEVLGCN